ncbi:MAG: riboflavin synthase [Gemmatimonadaceae bacterium]|nr:riboflavin synthase [Gemmatimonadaceae bacterium]
MFTGLVQEVATIDTVTERRAEQSAGSATELRISTGFHHIEQGESIAVNGACLTVCESGDGWFSVQAMGTTLGRTTVGRWRQGSRVNLERAMSANARFGGHIVQGHVDCIGEVVGVKGQEGATLVDIKAPGGFENFLVAHGSVAVDGVSLTVNAFPESDIFQVALIDFTLQHTNLSDLKPGSRVHLEGDVIGKYVQRAMESYVKGVSRE